MNVVALPQPGSAPIPHDTQAEQAVIGAALISHKTIEPVRVEEGLRADCFYQHPHRLIWRAIEVLTDNGEGVDTLTVARALRDRGHHQPAALVDQLPAAVPNVSNTRTYARRVLKTWRQRTQIQAHTEAIAAALEGDEDAHAAATARATDVIARAHLDPTPAGAQQRFVASQTEPLLPEIPLPWPTLARRFKMRPKATTVLASWTHWGKSWVALEAAQHAGENDRTVVLWTNEMGEEEVVARHVQRVTGISSDQVLDRDCNPVDVATAVKQLAFGVVECPGWPADEIARHIRHVSPDLAIVDHFHQIPGISRHDIAEHAVQTLTNAARQCGTHLLLVSQLNHQRDKDADRPPPALRDLKSTAALQDLPNNVLLLRRTQEHDKETEQTWLSDDGMLHVAKQRGSRSPLYQPVFVSPPKMRVLEMFGR